MSEETLIRKKIIQIEAAPPGWFVLYLGYGGEPEPDELCGEKLDGYFVVPMAGWALWEDSETGERGISPFMAEGKLVDENDHHSKIAFRPDWLNVRLNGAETITEGSPFGVSKNRLEVEVKKMIVKEG